MPKRSFLLAFLGSCLVALAACAPQIAPAATPTLPAAPTILPTQTPGVAMTVLITSVAYSKSFYKPGEPAKITVNLSSTAPAGAGAAEAQAVLTATFLSVNQAAGKVSLPLTLSPGSQSVELSWQPPAEAPRGYGLDVRIESPSGQLLASTASAFDVLERWTQNPRYGFMSDFVPGRSDAAQTMTTLTSYHVNGLQFYDWMYRHEQFLTDQEPYVDLFGRSLSIKTVNAMIAAAHERGIAAMPYSAVYACSLDFYKLHPDWAMFNADGTPHVFIEGKMMYMDPRPGSPWVKHLLAQFDDVLARTAFDGIHLDQYGDPKVSFDAQGNVYDVGTPLAEIINATHDLVAKDRPQGDGAVVFNAVTNWPIEKVAPAKADFVYIEVWAPYNAFTELHMLISQGQKLGGGKPVVLAAYIDPAMQVNARLMDAIIYASGGGHIALGEQNGYLAEAYFPNYKTLTPELSAVLKRYIEFNIRYEDVFGPSASEVTPAWQNRITIQGAQTSPSMMYDKVYPLVRENAHFTAINLVNMLGLKRGQWATQENAPTLLGAAGMDVADVTRPVKQMWFASPDGTDIALQPLAFSQQNGSLHVEIPGLQYWDMILIEWGD